jgi:hypothetical protein
VAFACAILARSSIQIGTPAATSGSAVDRSDSEGVAVLLRREADRDRGIGRHEGSRQQGGKDT